MHKGLFEFVIHLLYILCLKWFHQLWPLPQKKILRPKLPPANWTTRNCRKSSASRNKEQPSDSFFPFHWTELYSSLLAWVSVCRGKNKWYFVKIIENKHFKLKLLRLLYYLDLCNDDKIVSYILLYSNINWSNIFVLRVSENILRVDLKSSVIKIRTKQSGIYGLIIKISGC